MVCFNRAKDISKPILLLAFLSFFGLLFRFFIAFQDLSYLDRLFVPDDTFYILGISRFIAAGFGPSVDGVHLTSGIQPLVSFLLAPAFWLGLNGDRALIFSIYLSAFWGGLSTFLIGNLLNQIASTRAALIGATFWIFCPVIVNNDLNGMETSLAGFLSFLVILTTVIIDKKCSYLRLFCLGLLCGFTFLARVDTCFLLIVIGMFSFIRWGFKPTFFYTFIAFMVVLPWWLYAIKTFGTIIPESGSAVRQIVSVWAESYEFLPVISLYALIEWFPLFRVTLWGTLFGIILTFYLVGKGYYRAEKYGCLILFPFLFEISFYILYFPVYWFLTRYYYFIYAIILLSIALALDHLAQKKWKKTSGLSFFLILIGFISYDLKFFAKPEQAPNAVIESLKGYREVSLELNKHLHPGDVVGSFQSGALSYYAPQGIRIINLDGVVSREAAKALANRNLQNYVNLQGMNRFADWEGNGYYFRLLYGDNFPAACFNTLYRAKRQGKQNFLLRNYKPLCLPSSP